MYSSHRKHMVSLNKHEFGPEYCTSKVCLEIWPCGVADFSYKGWNLFIDTECHGICQTYIESLVKMLHVKVEV